MGVARTLLFGDLVGQGQRGQRVQSSIKLHIFFIFKPKFKPRITKFGMQTPVGLIASSTFNSGLRCLYLRGKLVGYLPLYDRREIESPQLVKVPYMRSSSHLKIKELIQQVQGVQKGVN